MKWKDKYKTKRESRYRDHKRLLLGIFQRITLNELKEKEVAGKKKYLGNEQKKTT